MTLKIDLFYSNPSDTHFSVHNVARSTTLMHAGIDVPSYTGRPAVWVSHRTGGVTLVFQHRNALTGVEREVFEAWVTSATEGVGTVATYAAIAATAALGKLDVDVNTFASLGRCARCSAVVVADPKAGVDVAYRYEWREGWELIGEGPSCPACRDGSSPERDESDADTLPELPTHPFPGRRFAAIVGVLSLAAIAAVFGHITKRPTSPRPIAVGARPPPSGPPTPPREIAPALNPVPALAEPLVCWRASTSPQAVVPPPVGAVSPALAPYATSRPSRPRTVSRPRSRAPNTVAPTPAPATERLPTIPTAVSAGHERDDREGPREGGATASVVAPDAPHVARDSGPSADDAGR